MIYFRVSQSLFLVVAAAVLVPLPLSAQASPRRPGSAPLTDLRAVLDTGVVLQDRNGDEVVDFLHLKLLLASEATEAEVVAAANLAARFAFETSATNLGLATPVEAGVVHSSPVIVLGRRALEAGAGSESAAALVTELAPGQGVLAHLPPGGSFAEGGVVLLGRDATGLLAAAAYLSGHYPAVWTLDGIRWREVVETVEAFTRTLGLESARANLDRIVLDASRLGVPRATVTLSVSAEDFERTVRAFHGRAEVEDSATAGEPSPREVPDSVPDSGGGEEELTALSDLQFLGLHRLDVRIVSPGGERVVPVRPDEPWEIPEAPAYRRGSDPSFSLPHLYTVNGLFRDTNHDLVPDETVAFLSVRGGAAAPPVVDLATRIGLETAGIRLPLVRIDGQEDDPTASGFPVLMGTDHYQIRRLQEAGKLPNTDVGPGEGFVQLVDEAFEERNALVVGGADDVGLAAATDWLARRAPYLWRYGKGEYHLADAETEVRRFLQARQGSGQAALALAKLGQWMDRMAEQPPVRIEVEMAAQEAPVGLAEVAAALVRERFPEARVEVGTWPTGFGVGDTIFKQEWNLPWEVDEARALLEAEVYPNLHPGEQARLQIRVSEPPEVRARLETEIRNRLAERGVESAQVHVLSAYKQGYSWIHDLLLPRLRELDVASVEITYHTLEESEEVRWQTIAAEERWIQELYPIDAILARELGISDSAVTFHATRERDPIYTFTARDAAGNVLLRDTFNPRYVIRPFFDLFPEYEQVRVTTGWITASSGDRSLVDRRIVTDPERFWDRLQTETYAQIIAYIMDSQDGSPERGNAPFFDEFRVDLRLSEPDYRIGVDEETISSLEALHEDLFFQTHTLIRLMAGRYETSLPHPGRVLPFVDPTGAGQPGHARISLTGKERGNSELVVRSWAEGDDLPLLQRYDLSPLPVEHPRLVGAVVKDGQEGLRRLLVRVEVRDSLDRYQEFKARESELAIDRQLVNVELLEGMLSSLERLHRAGLMGDVLSWDRLDELALDFRLEKDSTYQHTVILSQSTHPSTTDNPRLNPGDWTYEGERIVQWDTPISVEENENLLARLATFPGVNGYFLTDSYLGHRVWAADFLPPHEAEFVSQAKLNAVKPTLFVTGRRHANEVSSTSHILRLGELLVTDSAHRALLARVNVVLHPMANPDGAAVAYERQLVNPDHLLHVGRHGALGVSAGGGEDQDDPIYPEFRAGRMIREAWLPDIVLIPHGYTSHEWVQLFAGYTAWVRSRWGGNRAWWVPRGWFIPWFAWVDDEEYPDYKTAQFAILDSLAAAITGNPAVHAMNTRLYARYRKYGEQDRDGFSEYLHNGVVVSQALRGRESIGRGVYSPRITYFAVTTEAPDVTARGSWLDLMGQAGLAHTGAALRYLATGESRIERTADAFDQAIVRKVFRVKPVLPPPPEADSDAASGSAGGH